MSTSQTIPSRINATATVTAQNLHNKESHIYITAFLKNISTITVDGESLSSVGPISFSSPILCKSFTCAVGEVAYYIV